MSYEVLYFQSLPLEIMVRLVATVGLTKVFKFGFSKIHALSIHEKLSNVFKTILSSKSPAYNVHASCNCLALFMHRTPRVLALAFDSAGSSIPARIAIIAMTTRSSINVNARAAALRLAGKVSGFIRLSGTWLFVAIFRVEHKCAFSGTLYRVKVFSTCSGVRPFKRSILWRAVSPRTRTTADFGRFSVEAINSMTARFAAESTGGAVTLIFSSEPSASPISFFEARGIT